MDQPMEKVLYNYGRLEWNSGISYGIPIGIGIGCTITCWVMNNICRCYPII